MSGSDRGREKIVDTYTICVVMNRNDVAVLQLNICSPIETVPGQVPPLTARGCEAKQGQVLARSPKVGLMVRHGS